MPDLRLDGFLLLIVVAVAIISWRRNSYFRRAGIENEQVVPVAGVARLQTGSNEIDGECLNSCESSYGQEGEVSK